MVVFRVLVSVRRSYTLTVECIEPEIRVFCLSGAQLHMLLYLISVR